MVDTTYNPTFRGTQAPPTRDQQVVGHAVEHTRTSVPAFQFSVVECYPRFTIAKTFKPNWNEIIPEKRPAKFRFYFRQLETLEEFAKALEWLSDQPRMGIIPGQLLPGVGGYQRRIIDPFNPEGYPVTIECPVRSYLNLDLDDVLVPYGLGAPDKVVEAGYYIRDHLLPHEFRAIRCVVTPTAKTGKKLTFARIRLWFLLSQCFDIDVLVEYLSILKKQYLHLGVDASVMQSNQITYTARPQFDGWDDPVPEHCRVGVLEGYDDYVTLDLSNIKPKRHRNSRQSFAHKTMDIPEWLPPLLPQDAGKGIGTLNFVLTDKGRSAIHRAFEMLDECPKGNDRGRHKEMLEIGWELTSLYFEQEISKRFVMKTFFKAARNIKYSANGRIYTIHDVKDHLRSAFDKMGVWYE